MAPRNRPRYQPYYCEENIWHLAQAEHLRNRPRRVVFVSNQWRSVALWRQRAAPEPRAPLVWDYHVFLLAQADMDASASADAAWSVWDLDTTLSCPVSVQRYLRETFPAPEAVPIQYAPQFRVFDADGYVRDLRTDRSHMRTPDGTYAQPPPTWPHIGAPGQPPNLMQYVDVHAAITGETYDLVSFLRAFASPGIGG